jgi:hypothetical protein
MAEQGSILVFPGGAREVFQRKGEQYRLLWGKRTGFAHLAIEHGYAIVPFSAVGAEDAFDILIDAEELLASPIGPLNPSARSSGRRRRAGRARDRSIMLPRPERFYFRSVGRVRALPSVNSANDAEVAGPSRRVCSARRRPAKKP